jgi:hypothetical protein
MTDRLNKLRYYAFALLALSSALIILSVYFYIEKNNRLEKYKLIKCKIIKIEEPSRGDVQLTFRDLSGNYPAFKYYDSYDPSEDELEYKLNEIYEVYYFEKDTGKSEIKDFAVNYETALILFIIGFVFFIDFPIMLFVSKFAKKRRQQGSSEHYGIKDSVISE